MHIFGSCLLKPPRPGDWGEYCTGLFLLAHGWEILHQRWRCRWGEIDIIARRDTADPLLAFVEVKTRRSRSWDDGGLFSITPQKQAKICSTAQMFLAAHPNLSSLPCRFDVALVTYRHLQNPTGEMRTPPLPRLCEPLLPPLGQNPFQIGQPVVLGPYQLTLHQYLEAAFTSVSDDGI
nr:YraN family protein [[Phormidium] sp. ETS-05]